jgi:hypothetical protein
VVCVFGVAECLRVAISEFHSALNCRFWVCCRFMTESDKQFEQASETWATASKDTLKEVPHMRFEKLVSKSIQALNYRIFCLEI